VAELTETIRDAPMPALRRAPMRAVIAWGGGSLIALLALAGTAFQIADGPFPTPAGVDYVPTALILCLAFGLPGAILVKRDRAPVVGLIGMLIGVSVGVAFALTGYASRALTIDPGSLPAGEAAVWIVNWCWIPGYCAVGLLLLVLPDGRLASPRWRPALVLGGLACVTFALGTIFSPYLLDELPAAFGRPVNPTVVEPLGEVLTAIGWTLVAAFGLVSVISLVLRFRHASGTERDQLTWVALGGSLTVLILAVAGFSGSYGDVVSMVAVIPLPASIAIAVLRHQLFAVDLVINRSLVYVTLTLAVIALYVAVVALIGDAVDDTVAGIVAVAVVAVALQPLHARLRRAVNELVYGDRDDPAAALERLGDRLVAAGEPDEVLPAVGETVARALRLPAVEVTTGDEGEYPAHERADMLRLDLVYAGRKVGELAAAPREPGRGFSPADRRALETIARQVAPAAHAVQLTADLRRSRERLVLAREEERRRLRHDLHDDLGPTLAALALELESARELVRERPDQVDATLDRAAARARDGVADVRRLVYDLRPPTLDDLGLAGALRERAAQLSGAGLEVTVEAPERLGELPAAVESAAWRIASEALQNASRHSGAHRCKVRIEREPGALIVSVSDDGRGIDPAAERGVGFASMRERAEELGGELQIRALERGGTEVLASLHIVGGAG
jgi:two-component system NarL family sensor kinase